MSVVLVSGSPRRRLILERLGIPHTVVPHGFDEETVREKDMPPPKLVELIAVKKLEHAALDLRQHGDIVAVSADTMVFTGGRCFGKPKNRAEAAMMLAAYSGTVHRVVSAVACFSTLRRYITSRVSVSSVFVEPLTNADIQQYLDTNEWQGVAGGYRIQERGGFFVSRIDGSYSGIEGLPIFELYGILTEHGLKL